MERKGRSSVNSKRWVDKVNRTNPKVNNLSNSRRASSRRTRTKIKISRTRTPKTRTTTIKDSTRAKNPKNESFEKGAKNHRISDLEQDFSGLINLISDQ